MKFKIEPRQRRLILVSNPSKICTHELLLDRFPEITGRDSPPIFEWTLSPGLRLTRIFESAVGLRQHIGPFGPRVFDHLRHQPAQLLQHPANSVVGTGERRRDPGKRRRCSELRNAREKRFVALIEFGDFGVLHKGRRIRDEIAIRPALARLQELQLLVQACFFRIVHRGQLRARLADDRGESVAAAIGGCRAERRRRK
jgi:hypothetical protein